MAVDAAHTIGGISQSNPKGAANACSGKSFRGGVSPRNTCRLRGQSTAEYVLIIAIIGLVVVFAGPWIASAIRNQFNAVTETLDEGTTENAFKDPVDIPDPQHGTAFAVYSADDDSLMFYKRRGVPRIGDMFNDRRVTEVYTGFETARYRVRATDDVMAHDWTCKSLPWWNWRTYIQIVDVVDEGIAPSSISGWFMRMTNLASADLSNLDCAGVDTAWCAFLRCPSLTTLMSPKNFRPTDLRDFVYWCVNLKNFDASDWDLSRCRAISYAFDHCKSLKAIPGAENWNVKSLKDADGAFSWCDSLELDCSGWDVRPNADWKNFNIYSPGVTIPKVWQND